VASPDPGAGGKGGEGGEGVEVRSLRPEDEATAEAFLDETMAGRVQVRLGEAVDALAADGAGAAVWQGGRLVGVATWTSPDPVGATELVLLAVAADRRGQGVGGTLLEAAAEAASAAGATSQWLVTTNDNLDALRLYQRHGYRLVALRPGAVDEARRQKPAIPAVGRHGIPLHDELVLERLL
jgi:ribosomal protein S18 acetylase RimI-like enzyme